MNEERMRVLNMVREKTLSVDEGAALLSALGAGESSAIIPAPSLKPKRWFRVRVTDSATGRLTANIRLPMGMVKFGLNMGGIAGYDTDELYAAFAEAAAAEHGTLVEVDEGHGGERVEISLE